MLPRVDAPYLPTYDRQTDRQQILKRLYNLHCFVSHLVPIKSNGRFIFSDKMFRFSLSLSHTLPLLVILYFTLNLFYISLSHSFLQEAIFPLRRRRDLKKYLQHCDSQNNSSINLFCNLKLAPTFPPPTVFPESRGPHLQK